MAIVTRFFAAFCVATVVAQILILGLMAAKGNLRSDTLTQAIALANGIDVTGQQLEKAFNKVKEAPVPSYEDVVSERAKMNIELQSLQDAINREKEMVVQMQSDLSARVAEFDRRRQEFFTKLDEMDNKLATESLLQVQHTIEELAPNQAKSQLVRMLDDQRIDDVVAIVKTLDAGKRKKILAEFADGEEGDKLHEMLMRMLAGEPTASLVKDSRKNSPEGRDVQ